MNKKNINKLAAHFDRYFNQISEKVIYSELDTGYVIDVMVYEPTDELPFYKLVTVGASDYKCKFRANSILTPYNEYMMFVSKDVDLLEDDNWSWYYNKLMLAALYPKETDSFLTYQSMVNLGEDKESDMTGVYITFPQIINEAGILHAKLGILKKVTCLQVMPITKKEQEIYAHVGADALEDKFYPDNGQSIFLAEKFRTR